MTNARPHVAVTRAIPESGLALLRAVADVDIWPHDLPPESDQLQALLTDADGAVTLLTDTIDDALLAGLPKLRIISNFAVGYDNIDVAAATGRGVAVCNTPGVLTEATAELAWALIMACARRLPEAETYVRDGEWQTWGPKLLLGQPLSGRTIGIVGFGRIGQIVARIASGFNMRVLVWDRSSENKQNTGLDVTFTELPDLLSGADIVSLHVPLDESTHHLIDAETLHHMKPSAILVNTARGPIVDQDALLAALRDGTIFAAGLDVTDPEPLPADHPLVAQPNCLVVPHIGSATIAARNAMAELAARNLIAILSGETPPHIVNPDVLNQGAKP